MLRKAARRLCAFQSVPAAAPANIFVYPLMMGQSATGARSLAFLFTAPVIEPRLRQAFSGAALASTRVAMFAKLAAAAIVAVFLVAQFPSWAVLYWIVIAVVFGGAGVLQYRLARRRPRAWRKYAFM